MLQKGSFRHPFLSSGSNSRRSFRFSGSQTPTMATEMARERMMAPSVDVFQYDPPTVVYNNGQSQASSEVNSPKESMVGANIMRADAGLRRAFTRTNSMPMNLHNDRVAALFGQL